MSEERISAESVISIFQKYHYEIFQNQTFGNDLSFDLIAKYQPRPNLFPTLIIKVLPNIDNIKPHFFNEINIIAHLLAAVPLIIALRNRHSNLSDNCIYLRNDIIAINLNTLVEVVKNPKIPLALAFAKKGGFFLDVDGEKILRLRKEKGYSRQYLAEKLNVTTKTISHYETKGMRSSINNVKAMEKIFDESVISPLDFFAYLTGSSKKLILNKKVQKRIFLKSREFMKSINEIVEDTGFHVFWPKTSPFDLFIYRWNFFKYIAHDYTFVGGTCCESRRADGIYGQRIKH